MEWEVGMTTWFTESEVPRPAEQYEVGMPPHIVCGVTDEPLARKRQLEAKADVERCHEHNACMLQCRSTSVSELILVDLVVMVFHRCRLIWHHAHARECAATHAMIPACSGKQTQTEERYIYIYIYTVGSITWPP